MHYHRIWIGLLLGLASASSAWAEEPLIHYQRTHSLVAHADNSIRLDVFADGRVEAHFPLHSPQAGTHRWRITQAQLDDLLARVAPVVDIGAENLLDKLQARRSGQLIEVTDADPVVLFVNAGSRGSKHIALPSPEIWSRQFPDDADLATLSAAAGELADWMRRHAREQVR